MSDLEPIASQIRKIGFQCQRCGKCCRGEDMRVMVYPEEVRALIRQTGYSWGEVAEPYPENVTLPTGQRCTFEWALRKVGDRCAFLEEGRCRIHPCRPWICRTYPFVLSGSHLLQGECPGLGKEIGEVEALALARDLLQRQETELVEEERIRFFGTNLDRVKGRHILIDGEGVKVLDP